MSQKVRKVFLSYARADREPALRISEYLRKTGFQVWDPEIEILPGSDFAALLQKALESSQALVVLISPKAMESSFVAWEISYALGAEHIGGRLIPVLLRRTKDAPWILDELKYVPYQDPDMAGKMIVERLRQSVDAAAEVRTV